MRTDAQKEQRRQNYKRNPEKDKANTYRWRKENPFGWKMIVLKTLYGLTAEQFKDLFIKQDGRCAICKKKWLDRKDVSVDHDHVSEKVRGLLCQKCNKAIGLLQDDPLICAAAAEYLRKTK